MDVVSDSDTGSCDGSIVSFIQIYWLKCVFYFDLHATQSVLPFISSNIDSSSSDGSIFSFQIFHIHTTKSVFPFIRVEQQQQ